jgi:hypothetical protein
MHELQFVSRSIYELLIRIRDDLKRPIILDSGVIGLARAGEKISYTRGVEANRINFHTINFCMSETVQVN